MVLVVTAALMLLVESRNFIMLFVALETVTVGFYILVSYYGSNPKTLEAGLKYLVTGALSSALLLFGIVLLYGVAGSPALTGRTAEAMQYGPAPAGFYRLDATPSNFHGGREVSIVLVLAGDRAPRSGPSPFQIWIPDVLPGRPDAGDGFPRGVVEGGGLRRPRRPGDRGLRPLCLAGRPGAPPSPGRGHESAHPVTWRP